MTRIRRFRAACVAVLLLLCMLCSIAFVAVESNHHCSGDSCTVCHQISVCQKLIDQLAGASLPAALRIATAWVCSFVVVRPGWVLCARSPVDFKVKLSN